MPSPFEEALVDFSDAIDEVMGEPLLHTPMRKPDDASPVAADPTRRVRTLIGTVTLRPLVAGKMGQGANTRDNALVTVDVVHVSFDGAVAGVVDGDHVRRTTKPGRPVLRLLPALDIPGRLIFPAVPA